MRWLLGVGTVILAFGVVLACAQGVCIGHAGPLSGVKDSVAMRLANLVNQIPASWLKCW